MSRAPRPRLCQPRKSTHDSMSGLVHNRRARRASTLAITALSHALNFSRLLEVLRLTAATALRTSLMLLLSTGFFGLSIVEGDDLIRLNGWKAWRRIDPSLLRRQALSQRSCRRPSLGSASIGTLTTRSRALFNIFNHLVTKFNRGRIIA